MTSTDNAAPEASQTQTADEAASFEAVRQARKQALVIAMRVFAKQPGMEFGYNGHITVRDPEFPELVWANPWKVPFGYVRTSELLLVDSAGTIHAGPDHLKVSGFKSQHALHSARADAVAVVHVHSEASFVWSGEPRLIPPINTDSALVYGIQAIYEDFGRPPGGEYRSSAEALGDTAKILIQRKHGFVTIGRSIEEATFLFLAAERAARMQLDSQAVGHADVMPAADAARWTLQPGNSEDHFQPYASAVIASEEDLL